MDCNRFLRYWSDPYPKNAMISLPKLPFLTKALSFLRYGDRLRPHKDWFILLSVSLVLLIASIAWNVWFFFSVVEENLSVGPPPPEEALDRSALEAARAISAKEDEEDTRYRNEYQFVDPSQ